MHERDAVKGYRIQGAGCRWSARRVSDAASVREIVRKHDCALPAQYTKHGLSMVMVMRMRIRMRVMGRGHSYGCTPGCSYGSIYGCSYGCYGCTNIRVSNISGLG